MSECFWCYVKTQERLGPLCFNGWGACVETWQDRTLPALVPLRWGKLCGSYWYATRDRDANGGVLFKTPDKL